MQTRLKYKILSILIITCLNLIAQAEQPFKLNKIALLDLEDRYLQWDLL